MSKKEHVSINDKLDAFIEIYESTFGQSPTAILLSREQLKEFKDNKRTQLMDDPIAHSRELLGPLNHNGVLIQVSQKQRIEDERKELEELRKLKDSLSLIKDVLKV